MNQPSSKIIAVALMAGLALSLAGCKCPCKKAKGTDSGEITWDPNEDAKVDPTVTITIHPRDPNNPSPSYGTLAVPVTSFTSGSSTGCFPSSQGWNKYYVSFYFLGPNVSPLPINNNYPNPDNLSSVTIDTEDASNGTALDTGILIVDNLNPNSKVCNDDDPTYTANPKLSKATFNPTGTNRKYRVGIFYKGSTAAGVNTVLINWHYP
jgi:hypothetical protein